MRPSPPPRPIKSHEKGLNKRKIMISASEKGA
jgi:hypothetical protein